MSNLMHRIDKYTFNTFILKEFFEMNYGKHYPREIIQLIITTLKPVHICAGSTCTIISGNKNYLFGKVTELNNGDNYNHTLHELGLHNIKSIHQRNNSVTILMKCGEIYSYGEYLHVSEDQSSPNKVELTNVKDVGC